MTSLTERYNFDNNYRNAKFQQSGAITTPGAVAALHDLTGTLFDAMQRMIEPGSNVERAKNVKVYMARGNEILDRVRKYPPRGSVPNNLRLTLDAISATHQALQEVYAEARRLAQGELLREAGL